MTLRTVRSDDKGKFSANISDDVIAEALKSVEKRSAKASPAEAGVDLEVDQAGAAPAGPDEATAAPPEARPDERARELEELKAQVEMSTTRGRELMERIKDEHEKMLRAAADLENFKKRAQREKDDIQKFGNERLLKDFLPVVDNLDRALEHARTATDYESLRKGVEMIRKLFEDTLGKHGVKSFSGKGKPFDPNLHEAMSAQETAEVPPNHVVNEVLRGYTLNDRLVRPALVVVSKTPEAPASAPPEPAAEPTPPPASDTPTNGGSEPT